MKSKTMVYFERAELEALRARAKRERISLTEAVRRAVRLSLERDGTARAAPLAEYRKLVALGESGRQDVASKHDAELAKALRAHRRVR
jgi:hypothetical protein